MAVRDCYENQERGFAVKGGVMVDERQLTIADVEGVMSNGDQPAVEFTGEIHPVADLFPMMTDDELDDLAADIKASGLIHPIVLDDEGQLIDGRNRFIGCQRAGIEPRFTTMHGHDPVAFILSANVTRRHLNTGQQAMGCVMAELFRTKKCDGLKSKVAQSLNISASRISKAILVSEHLPDLCKEVLAGGTPLDVAYEKARKERDAAVSRETMLATLRGEAPDLFSLVQEERLSLGEACATLEKRQREERERIAAITRRFDTILTVLDPASMNADEWASDWLNADPKLIGEHGDFSAERALRAADTLSRYARLKKEKENGEAA